MKFYFQVDFLSFEETILDNYFKMKNKEWYNTSLASSRKI